MIYYCIVTQEVVNDKTPSQFFSKYPTNYKDVIDLLLQIGKWVSPNNNEARSHYKDNL